MTYTLEDLDRDFNITKEELDQHVAAIRKDMQLYELREARKARGLTQEQIAEQMGVNQKRVSAIERGGSDHAMVETLRKYMEALGGKLEVVGTLPDGERVLLA